MEFNYFKYNFDEDELFKTFVQSHKEYGSIPRKRFRSFMCKWEREYVQILNSPLQRLARGIPDGWGEQFVVE